MAERVRGVVIAIALCLFAIPIAVVLTVLLIPLWRWLENILLIESIGHSGPAEWTYLATYIVVIICISIIWQAIMKRSKS